MCRNLKGTLLCLFLHCNVTCTLCHLLDRDMKLFSSLEHLVWSCLLLGGSRLCRIQSMHVFRVCCGLEWILLPHHRGSQWSFLWKAVWDILIWWCFYWNVWAKNNIKTTLTLLRCHTKRPHDTLIRLKSHYFQVVFMLFFACTFLYKHHLMCMSQTAFRTFPPTLETFPFSIIRKFNTIIFKVITFYIWQNATVLFNIVKDL